MSEKNATEFRALDDKLKVLADAIRTLQLLVNQHQAAIQTITQLIEEQDRVHPAL